MKKLKKFLMTGVAGGLLLTSTSGMAAPSTAAWVSAGVGALVSIVGTMMAVMNTGMLIVPGPIGVYPNIDPAQLVVEYMVLDAIKSVKDDWDPEPAKEYEKAAESNGGAGGTNAGGVTFSSAVQTLPFQVAALQNVGIEAIGVGPELSEIASVGTRNSILEELAWLQPKGSGSSSNSDEGTGAGSCGSSYSFCLREMTTEEEAAVRSTQKVNKQDFGTAGITHAELGLRAVQQAIVNDGGSSIGKTETSNSSSDVNATGSKKPSVQNLSALIGTGANTVAAMKIVSLMNLELAQRLNQGNMMQGASLTIEAARAFPKTEGIMK